MREKYFFTSIKVSIPETKYENVKSSYYKKYGPKGLKKRILLLGDDTFWGGAKDGICLTRNYLISSKGFHIDLRTVTDIQADKKIMTIKTQKKTYTVDQVLLNDDYVALKPILKKWCKIVKKSDL